MATYSQAKKFIKHYRRYEILYNEAHHLTAVNNDGMPHGTGTSDPTAAAAARAERFMNKMLLIKSGLKNIPDDYKDGVFRHLVDGLPFPDTAEEATWYRWQQIYVNCVAVLLE